MLENPQVEIKVKRLGNQDLKLMNRLLDCFGTEFAEQDTYGKNRPDDAYLRELLGSDGFVALVALGNNIVLGGLAAYELRKFEQKRSEIYIYDLAVAEPFRRRGIATALIEALKPIAHQRGAWTIFVQADNDDDPAIGLYSRLGNREDVVHFDIPVAARDQDA